MPGAAAAIIAFLSVAGAVSGAVIEVPADQPTIQAAIVAAQSGDEIVVAAGTWHETIDLLGKAITLRSTDPADPAVVEATVIDGDGTGTVVACRTREGPDTVIDGLTITGGDGNSGGAGINGGGLHVGSTSPTIRRCLFIGNTAFGGGGMLIETGLPTVDRCRFIGNTVDSLGGAVYCRFISAPVFIDCLFEDNHAVFRGGAMIYETTDGSISGCVFRNNHSDEESGAMHIKTFSCPQFTDCTFDGNVAATEQGGAVRAEHQTAVSFAGCVFTDNTGTEGGAIFNNRGANTSVGTSSFCGNAPDAIAGAYTDDGGNTFAAACVADCPGDADGDGLVDVNDLVAVIVDWDTDGSASGGDVVPDGIVDVNDLVAVIQAWGPCEEDA